MNELQSPPVGPSPLGQLSERAALRTDAAVNALVAPAARPLRLALLLDLMPRKLGSMEDWLCAMARHAASRGHAVDVFCREPMHPTFRGWMQQAGTRLFRLEELLAKKRTAVRRLAGYDVLQFNFFQVRQPIPLLCYAAATAKVVYVDHTSGQPGVTRNLRTRMMDALVARRLARVVGVSSYVRERDLGRFRLPPERVVCVHNGVDLARFRSVRPPRTAGQPLQLLAVAHLIRWKGLEVLLRALAEVGTGGPILKIVGDGPDRPRLQALVDALGISPRVEFLGLRDDVAELLGATDVFVHPATWEEAFGLTIAEAMASGLPVVASRTGAIPELIRDGESGLLFEPGDSLALATALRRLLDDEGLRRQLGEGAALKAATHFDLQTCARRHIEVLEQAAGLELPRL